MNSFLEALAQDDFFRRFIPENVLAQLAMRQYQQRGMPEHISSDLGTYPSRKPETFYNMPDLTGTLKPFPPRYMDMPRTLPQMQTLDRKPIDPQYRRQFNWM